ncbi:uncharacterized protein LOC141707445 isoform X2 [Apium graveolens]|uniref:uncharacterized protein LOC141707445 isoform X2 n=1 Tax=Apium graveolens TaxID=4045 RepID=UPI003D7B4931
MPQSYLLTQRSFSCKDHNLIKSVINITDDTRLSNLHHGEMFHCTGKKGETTTVSTNVSLFTSDDFSEVCEMMQLLESLYALASLNVCKPHCVGRLTDGNLTSVPVDIDIPSKVKMFKREKPCLIMQQVPTKTYDDWILTATEQDISLFFRSLLSIVGKFHQASKCFGNIRAGLRVTHNCPIFVFPAAFEEEKLDDGIRSDLVEIHEMVLESGIQGFHERQLFDKLCKKFTQITDGSFTYNGESLRDGSFLITHCPVVWTPEDRYDFIEKLGNYRKLNKYFYDLFFGADAFGKAIPFDLWMRIDTAAPPSIAFILQGIYTSGKNTPYASSDAIRIIHKYAYELKLDEYPSWLDMEKVLYSVCPEAPAILYDMIIDLQHFQSNSAVSMNKEGLIIKFLQYGPSKFDF